MNKRKRETEVKKKRRDIKEDRDTERNKKERQQ